MCDANYPPGHYHSGEKSHLQKAFKEKGLNFHQRLQWLFDKVQMKPVFSVEQKKERAEIK